MIYDEPKFLPGGDRYVLIEFGNEMNLELNFIAQGLAARIVADKTRGIVETAPCFASMLVHYEPREISYDDVVKELKALIASLGSTDDIELDSRLFLFETMYLDPGPGNASRTTARRSRPRSMTRTWWRGSTASPTATSSSASTRARSTGWPPSASGRGCPSSSRSTRGR